MTVDELITKLQEFPKDMVVLVSGYESGYNEAKEVEIKNLCRVHGQPYYDGDYQYPRSSGPKREVKGYLVIDN